MEFPNFLKMVIPQLSCVLTMLPTPPALCVRAVDVGYGYVKFTTGRTDNNTILSRSIPSLSPIDAPETMLDNPVMATRNTVLVPVNGRNYEVGYDAHLALAANQITEILDNDFALSDHYAARLLGAINYMELPVKRIDFLVLGLPLNTYSRHKDALSARFQGNIPLNQKKETVEIKHCHVYPQPLGTYMSYMATRPQEKNPRILCVDPGYNTLDWFVCQGMTAIAASSGAVKRGMGAMIKAIADEMIRKHGFENDSSELVRLIDQSLISKQPVKIYGREYLLRDYLQAGADIIEQGVQAVRDSVGDGKSISSIVISGGGSTLYEAEIRKKFPHHPVALLVNPTHANVRGFHLLGEMLAGHANLQTGSRY